MGHVIHAKHSQLLPKPAPAGPITLCNYYRKFIRNFTDICKPLDNLTCKATLWQWMEVEQKAWDTLKEEFLNMPNLAAYISGAPLRLEIDSSGYAPGNVLIQHQEDGA